MPRSKGHERFRQSVFRKDKPRGGHESQFAGNPLTFIHKRPRLPQLVRPCDFCNSTGHRKVASSTLAFSFLLFVFYIRSIKKTFLPLALLLIAWFFSLFALPRFSLSFPFSILL